MSTKFKARCERVRPNNGIVEVLFTRRAEPADRSAQDEHVLANLQVQHNQFQEGQFYWIDIAPAFPH